MFSVWCMVEKLQLLFLFFFKDQLEMLSGSKAEEIRGSCCTTTKEIVANLCPKLLLIGKIGWPDGCAKAV